MTERIKITKELLLAMCHAMFADCDSNEELEKWTSKDKIFQQILENQKIVDRIKQVHEDNDSKKPFRPDGELKNFYQCEQDTLESIIAFATGKHIKEL